MSAGVATCPGDAKDENALFVAADRALYQAKASGKNQVYLFGESTRSYARRRIAWRGYVEPVGSAGFPIETIEIGEGGFSFRSDRDVSTDTLLEASLTAPDGRTLRVAGRVVWKRALGPGLPEIAIRFVEAGSLARESLSEWISGHDGGTAPSLMEQFRSVGCVTPPRGRSLPTPPGSVPARLGPHVAGVREGYILECCSPGCRLP